jgi:hypothetical protein
MSKPKEVHPRDLVVGKMYYDVPDEDIRVKMLFTGKKKGVLKFKQYDDVYREDETGHVGFPACLTHPWWEVEDTQNATTTNNN